MQWCLVLALACFSALGAPLVFALSAPTISVDLQKSGLVKLDLFVPRQTHGPNIVLQLQRAQNGHKFRPLSNFKKPSSLQSVYDLLTQNGKYRYRARLVKGKRSSAWRLSSELIYAEVNPNPSPDTSPILPSQPTDLPQNLGPGQSDCGQAVLDVVLERLNWQRRTASLAELASDPLLTLAARAHSIEMASTSSLDHKNWLDQILASGFRGLHLAQNVANKISDPQAVVDALIQSPGHRMNILDPESTHVGLACIIDSQGTYWWTQNFGN